MGINKYDVFILESLMTELILESKLVYLNKFKDLLKQIMSEGDTAESKKVARFLLKVSNSNRDFDLVQNYIDIDVDKDKVSFIPDNRVKPSDKYVSLNTNDYGELTNVLVDHSIIDMLKITRAGLKHPMNLNSIPSNKWEVVGEGYPGSDAGTDYSGFTLYRLRNVDDPNYYVISYDNSSDGTKAFTTHLDYSNIQRNSIKIGRFVNKIVDIWKKVNPDDSLLKSITSASIEKFVNNYVSTIMFNTDVVNRFKIVDGEAIKYWYNVENYAHKIGQLGSSCMRYVECQDFFNIYIKNPDVCKLVILTDYNEKLLGRALLWIDVDGKKWIDRIYTYKDSFLNLFKNWASNNGYSEIYGSGVETMVEVESEIYDRYPYMDTFSRLKVDEDSNKFYLYSESHKPSKPYYDIQNTNGRLSFYE